MESATKHLLTEEERAQETEAVKKRFDAIRQERGSRELWELAQEEVAPIPEDDHLLEDGTNAGEDQSEAVLKKQSKPKTAAEKKRRARNIKTQVR